YNFQPPARWYTFAPPFTFSKYDFDESLRDKIEDDLKNHSMYEYGTISYADLAEFLFQVGGCIFSVKNEETEK
ncbi:hypothetical protein ACFL3G_05260, partial [Planctomycetota bacterium]